MPIQRKARPIQRDKPALRDDRLFIVACDDCYAPKLYFDLFKITRVQVHVVPTTNCNSAAKHVLERLLEFEHAEEDQRWLVLDTDHCIQGTHLPGFLSVLSEAKKRGIHVALSRPCFEIWLLLHHVNESAVRGFLDANAVVLALRQQLNGYRKTHLERSQFPLSAVAEAVERGRRLDAGVMGGDVPQSNTTRVYKIWDAILESATPSQLPPELKG